jgi:hypothetical protein
MNEECIVITGAIFLQTLMFYIIYILSQNIYVI